MRDKRLATMVATLLTAFAVAHLMQFGLSAGRLISGDGQAAPIGLATLVARQAGDGPAMPEGPARPPAPASVAVALASPEARVLPVDTDFSRSVDRPRGNALGLDCARSLTARPGPNAVIRAEVVAPCDAGVRVEIAHAGLRFAVATGGDGRLRADIPAMRPDARVEARFADGSILEARVPIPEAAALDRFALVSEGWAGLTLHAVRGKVQARAEGRHAVVRLGDAAIDGALFAQVYTFPSGRFGALGRVGLELEAIVTPTNCARDVGAELVRSNDTDAPVRLGLSIPSCDAAGELLVLPLPQAGLRLAGK